jgi:DNA-directed RNA polymerase specialized sigma24 family protein
MVTSGKLNEQPGSMRFDWLCRPAEPDVEPRRSAKARRAEALAELPRVERSALALNGIGGLDADAIAKRLGTEPEIVRRLLAHARAAIRHLV